MLHMPRITESALEASCEPVVQAVQRRDWWGRGGCATAALHEVSDRSSSGIIHVGIRHHSSGVRRLLSAVKSVKMVSAKELRDWTRVYLEIAAAKID